MLACTPSGQMRSQAQVSDSIIYTEVMRRHPDRVFAIVDSLESANSITAMSADLWRGWSYHRKKQYDQAESHYRQALTSKVRTTADKSNHLLAAGYLSDLLYIKHDYEGALRVAVPVVQEIGDKEEDAIDAMVMLLSSVGRCQMKLHRYEEAQETFAREYDYNLKSAASDTTGTKLKNAMVHTANVAIRYLNAKIFDEAQLWIDRTQALLDQYAAHPSARIPLVNEYHARLAIYRAFTLENLGKPAEAAEAYKAFAGTDYGRSDDGRVDACEYLIAAHRFSEAADNLRELDRMMDAWDYKLTLDNIAGYLLPKFRANSGAGRRDSAYAVAVKICNALDSALVWQKNDDAAELATIYDTQQKEMKIAQQQADLRQQRLMTALIVLALMVVFLIIYSLYRIQVMKRLAEKNSQLKIANTKAEESSKMKTNFIQQISHEIRTPLNILSGFTQIITASGMELDEATKADIRRQITENTARITGLVNKMLELSEANTTTVIERAEQVQAVQIAAQAAEDSGISRAAHVMFDLHIAPETEELVLTTNQQAATRALTLLLDNARKFTQLPEAQQTTGEAAAQQTVRLAVETDGRQVRFTVEDTGIGVPKQEAEHIFDEFVQLNAYYDGTGIGLTVARSLARRLGGDIVLDTGYEGGARFVMTLPA